MNIIRQSCHSAQCLPGGGTLLIERWFTAHWLVQLTENRSVLYTTLAFQCVFFFLTVLLSGLKLAKESTDEQPSSSKG